MEFKATIKSFKTNAMAIFQQQCRHLFLQEYSLWGTKLKRQPLLNESRRQETASDKGCEGIEES
jgi:hypothetical protein